MSDSQKDTRQLKYLLEKLQNTGGEIVTLLGEAAPGMVAEMERLRCENAELSKLRETVAFYAKRGNYLVNSIDAQVAAQDFKPAPGSPVFEDRGRRARNALDAYNKCLPEYTQRQLEKDT